MRERIKSGIATAKARGKRLGRHQDSVPRTARRQRSSSWQRLI
ncbi:MAG TPA: hypothetical protein VNZ53_08460 [Steroidobacteraceae bacterium]|nr:hypothetical protein [Steroidobacteraceae bacterium]